MVNISSLGEDEAASLSWSGPLAEEEKYLEPSVIMKREMSTFFVCVMSVWEQYMGGERGSTQ